jgi:surface polysaccharide O-acyltransferase-like enzyme
MRVSHQGWEVLCVAASPLLRPSPVSLDSMSFPWIGSLPVVFSTCFLSIEMHLRVVHRRRRGSPYLSHTWYLRVNLILWLFCSLLVGIALNKKAENVSVASFQVVWMQAAVLKVGIVLH